jgi:hypothetical protein
MLPDKVFLVGAPGSRWSGIAQDIERAGDFNITDRTPDRNYQHHGFTGHLGVYFGTGWDHDISLDESNLDAPYEHTQGTRLLKSHEWCYHLDAIRELYPTAWIVMVYRPDLACYAWWHEAGGFGIKHPDYRPYYRDSINMLSEITQMNAAMFQFSQKQNLAWRHVSPLWFESTFGQAVTPSSSLADTLVCCYKP